MSDGRNENGRFVKGEYRGGPGRPRKAPEPSRQQIFTEVITPEKFRAVCQQIWLDAVGKKLGRDGKLVDDPRSTPNSRALAFARIAAYVFGRPAQPIVLDDDNEEKLTRHLQTLTDEELEAIIAETDRILSLPPATASGQLEDEDTSLPRQST